MSVHEKLMKARVALQGKQLKKSGHNKFAGYEYFELGDFLPTVQAIFSEVGLCGTITFAPEKAELTIVDVADAQSTIVFSCPMATAMLKGCHEVQNLGASMTYIRRYLWVNALEIVEHDALGAVTGKDDVKSKGAIKPADNQSFKPDAEEETFLLSVVDSLVALDPDYEAAAYKLAEYKLDADETTWVWNKMAPYSALRSGIKKAKAEKKG